MSDSADIYATMNCTADFRTSTLPKKVDRISLIATRPINNVSDIDGAQMKQKRELIKPDFTCNLDIEGSTSKLLHHSKNCRDNTLYVDDIDGARHFIKDRMLTTKRHTDPVNPKYNLPSFSNPVPYEPKFVNDSYNVSDIEGAQPKIPREYVPRETFKNDIIGAQANWRPRHERARLDAEPHDIMNKFNDISQRKLKPYEETNRRTNLCDPVYTIYGMEIKDDPRWSKPKALKGYVSGGTFSLSTHDVPGATSKYAPQNVRPRTEFRNLTSTLDIEGAQADTIKHSMSTKRETNPLNPVYQSLDQGRPLYNVLQPLLPAQIIKKPLILIGVEEKEGQGTTLSMEAKNEAKNMTELGWAPKTLQHDEDDNMYPINPPESSSKPPIGRFRLNIPVSTEEATHGRTVSSFRSNPNSTRQESVRLCDSGRCVGGGTGGSGRSNQSSDRAIKQGYMTASPQTSGRPVRMSSNDRKMISARKEEIDSVRHLQ